MDGLLTIVLAGGVGERLKPLTSQRAKSAVPFGGKFRIIDFILSNCINSGARHIYIFTQYKSESLHRHIQEGWGISGSGLGEYIYCIPAQQRTGLDWYRGTADAVRQNSYLVERSDTNHVLLLSGDHINKMNYLQMYRYHQAKDADITISAIRVRKEEAAGSFGVLEVGENLALIGFDEKPVQPKTIADAPDFCLVSMGIYMFKVSALRECLKSAGDDFGKEIIPKLIGKGFKILVYDYDKENSISEFAYKVENGKRKRILVDRTVDSSYWKDVGTIASYYEASMDLISVAPIFNLYGEKWPIRTYQRPLPPSKFIFGGRAMSSIISEGCIISGARIWHSILSPNVVVEQNSHVEQSIVFDDVIIEPNVNIRYTIIDKQARVQAGASIGYDSNLDTQRGCFISDSGIVVVPKGMDIAPA